ncbi:phosphate ABC transporter substrate-binding protein [Anaeromicropila herbilytica]|uniref:Phosphate-binding protein n=1 Tax=Anaeromicropila herbilytica TaxID=2785025 RepID=A0A7R7EP44_9FIRM|nr:phosphate ABC transporter substrate-binding protein [Anaeromicropila herbilytica]BCN32324.1 phosphate ABC transporter substrate-binding protein [Anaeromicropila herbilytica]
MKLKKVLATMLVGVMAVAFVGCGSKNTGDKKADTNTKTEATDNGASSTALKGTVVITGSTSVDKIITDMSDEFQALNPDVKINYTGTGSSAGISDSAAGSNTLGVSSRDLKDEEKSDKIHTDIFAYDGIAIAVNPANTVKDITLENLAKIYSGQITNWKDLGGKDAPIVVVSREGSSGTRDAFEELTKLEDAGGLVESATVVEGNGNAQTTVAGNENAIGYVSFSYIDKTVKELTLDGVEPTAEKAKSGEYKLSRPFLFVYNDDTVTPEAKAFIEYAKSADGQAFVEKHGGIKLD